jgi:condensin complex subunit 2
MERRRNAQIEMHQHKVTSPVSDKRRSIGVAIAGLSAAQLAEHYGNCIKLSAENVSVFMWLNRI